MTGVAKSSDEGALRTLAVVSLKGGSGKTTVATHLALAAHLRGVDTLVVDIDPQGSSSDVLGSRADAGPECVKSSAANLMTCQFAAVSAGKRLMIIDTPAGALEDVGEAVVLADYAVMVVRPTLLDLAGLARTLRLVNKLGKPAAVVLNQAPATRDTNEPPMVKRALAALDYMKAKVAPTLLRARVIFQTAVETGRSVEELTDPAAAREAAALWDFIAAELWDTERGPEVAVAEPAAAPPADA
jgi:chromosome partitioning protein